MLEASTSKRIGEGVTGILLFICENARFRLLTTRKGE